MVITIYALYICRYSEFAICYSCIWGSLRLTQNYGIPSAPLPLYMQWHIKLVQNIAFIDVLIYIAKRLVLVVVKL